MMCMLCADYIKCHFCVKWRWFVMKSLICDTHFRPATCRPAKFSTPLKTESANFVVTADSPYVCVTTKLASWQLSAFSEILCLLDHWMYDYSKTLYYVTRENISISYRNRDDMVRIGVADAMVPIWHQGISNTNDDFPVSGSSFFLSKVLVGILPTPSS